jgi:hypothetical protein
MHLFSQRYCPGLFAFFALLLVSKIVRDKETERGESSEKCENHGHAHIFQLDLAMRQKGPRSLVALSILTMSSMNVMENVSTPAAISRRFFSNSERSGKRAL